MTSTHEPCERWADAGAGFGLWPGGTWKPSLDIRVRATATLFDSFWTIQASSKPVRNIAPKYQSPNGSPSRSGCNPNTLPRGNPGEASRTRKLDPTKLEVAAAKGMIAAGVNPKRYFSKSSSDHFGGSFGGVSGRSPIPCATISLSNSSPSASSSSASNPRARSSP